jgi:prepilin-type processing-associated H-X9-DG protein
VAAQAAWAEEQTPPATERVVLNEHCQDLGALRERWLASELAKVWSSRALDQARAQLEQALAGVAQRTGVDILAALGDITAYRGQVVATGVAGAPTGTRVALALPHQGEPLEKALTALAEHGQLGGWHAARQGDWLLMANGCEPRLPEANAAGSGDMALHADLDAALSAHGLEQAAAVAGVFGAHVIDGSAVVADDGFRETWTMPGGRLPLATLDAATLARLPADVVLVLAFAIDGPRLQQQLDEAGRASKPVGEALAQAENGFSTLGIGELPDALKSITGTVVVAITPGTPFPAATVMLPASPPLDRVVDAAAAEQGITLAAARDGAVVLPLPPRVPVTLQIRRSATHWVLSTDPAMMDRCVGDPPTDGFDLAARLAPTGVAPAQARAFGWQDTRALALMTQQLLGMAAMTAGRGRGGDQRQQTIRNVGQVLAVLAPHLAPSVAGVTMDEHGVVVHGANAGEQALVAGIIAGAVLPGIAQARAAARRTSSGNNERQLVLACLVHANDNDGKWPVSLEEVAKEEKIDPKIFTSPSAPDLAGAYLYVRPTPDAGAEQPAVVEDPACNRGRGSMVCFADGHVEYVPGTLAWDEARRLSQLPKVRDAGIAPGDWGPIRPQRAQPAQQAPPAQPAGKADF